MSRPKLLDLFPPAYAAHVGSQILEQMAVAA